MGFLPNTFGHINWSSSERLFLDILDPDTKKDNKKAREKHKIIKKKSGCL